MLNYMTRRIPGLSDDRSAFGCEVLGAFCATASYDDYWFRLLDSRILFDFDADSGGIHSSCQAGVDDRCKMEHFIIRI